MPKPLITQYRPSSFDEVWGHKEEVRSLQQNLQDDTSRVFLFIGPSGIGKTTCARLIGQFHDAAIQEVDAGKYSGIDDCRDLTDSLRYHPIDGRKRCIIMNEVQALSKKAWDSLLMYIEEPPPYLIWVFTTTEAGKVPETIKTRSTVYQLKPLRSDELIDLLEAVCEAEQATPAQGVVDLCARSASGSPRAALSNLALCLGAQSRQEAARLLEEADEPTDAIELIRALVGGKQWDTIQPILSKLAETNPETIRHVCRAYLTKAILGTKDGGKVASYLGMLEHFSIPFLNSDQLTPVVMAVGRILFAEEESPF